MCPVTHDVDGTLGPGVSLSHAITPIPREKAGGDPVYPRRAHTPADESAGALPSATSLSLNARRIWKHCSP